MVNKKIFEQQFFTIESKLISKSQVLEFQVKKLKNAKIINNPENFLNDIYDREKLAPTALGHLIAIPHAKSKECNEPKVVVTKLVQPINWDGEQVQIVIMIAVPANNEDNIHLKILAKLAGALVNQQFLNQLITAKEGNELYELIKEKGEI